MRGVLDKRVVARLRRSFVASCASPAEIDRLRPDFLGADGKARLKPGELVTQLVGDALRKAPGDTASDVLKDKVSKPVIDRFGGIVTDLLKSRK